MNERRIFSMPAVVLSRHSQFKYKRSHSPLGYCDMLRGVNPAPSGAPKVGSCRFNTSKPSPDILFTVIWPRPITLALKVFRYKQDNLNTVKKIFLQDVGIILVVHVMCPFSDVAKICTLRQGCDCGRPCMTGHPYEYLTC